MKKHHRRIISSTMIGTPQHIVVFDGKCHFCNGAVNFIIRRDAGQRYVFTPMQSAFAQELIAQYDIPNVGIDTFLLIKHRKAFLWSDAALEIAKDLQGYWYLFNALKIIPRPLRDMAYRIFARHRYRLFGKADQCMVPTEALRSRFLGL